MMSEWRKAAQNLCDSERKEALRELLRHAKDPEAGIIRQILGGSGKPLTAEQQHVYDKYIEESLVEKCGRPGCEKFMRTGKDYCSVCEIEYKV